MKNRPFARRAVSCALLALSLLSGCREERDAAPVMLPHSESFALRSSATGRAYRIWVALPDGYSRSHKPYPVLYAADANGEFFTVVEAARLAAVDGEIPELIIVGIGYDVPGQTLAAWLGPRTLDLTPTVDLQWAKEESARAKDGRYAPPEGTGGAAQFLQFIRNDLVPMISRTYNVDPTDRGWFGHSFGGLFGLYTIFDAKPLFTRLLVGSPSLWWDRRMMFRAESTFAARHRALPAHVFLSVGSLEGPMVTDLDAFVAQLRARGYEGLKLDVQQFPGEAHDPVIPATISRGIRVLYAKPSP